MKEDESTTTTGTLALPFSHVMTPVLLEELNLFEEVTRNEYTKEFETKMGKVNRDRKEPLALYKWQDVTIQSVLGEGAFSVVFQVAMKKSGSSDDKEGHALKCIKAKSVETEDDLRYNAMDLLTEAHILMHTDHPNIISMTGVSDYSLGASYGNADGYFLLLEIMETTLMDTLNGWRKEVEFSKVKKKRLLSNEAMEQRLVEIALPVTSAVVYLHQHHIVLRDLKPENVGFDLHGTLKLFDFGLARLVHQLQDGEMAGSVCYMAPEVLMEAGTTLQSDVYSLAMMIWEIVTLQLPMAQFQTMEQVHNRVAKGQWRPSLSTVPIRPLRNLIKKGWAHNVRDRLTAKETHVWLYKICGLESEEDRWDLSSNAPSIRSLPVDEPEEKASFNVGTSMRSFFRQKTR